MAGAIPGGPSLPHSKRRTFWIRTFITRTRIRSTSESSRAVLSWRVSRFDYETPSLSRRRSEMTAHRQRTRLAPKLGKVSAILMTALLVVLASGCAPQPVPPTPPAAGGPSPNSAVAWIQPNATGGRDVYYLRDGKPILAGQLPAANPNAILPQAAAAVAACVWTPFGKVC